MDEKVVKAEVDIDPGQSSPDAQIRIWKISHGKNNDMSDSDHQLLLQANLVCIGYSDPKADGRSQRNAFVDKVENGDYFYLIRKKHIVLWGKFVTSDTTQPPKEFTRESWIARRIEIIKEVNFPSKNLDKEIGRAHV